MTLAAVALFSHPSCGYSECTFCPPDDFEIADQECATLPTLDWEIGPLVSLYAGQSRRVFLLPLVDDACESMIASIEWVSDDARVLDVPETGLPVSARRAWITGASRGETFLRARLHFADGQEVTSAAFFVRVEDFSPPGELIVSGFAPPVPGDTNRWVPFEVSDGGTLRAYVGGSFPIQLRLGFSVYEGPCDRIACPDGRFLHPSTDTEHRPMTTDFTVTPGTYTLRIDEAEGEPVAFEVRRVS